MKPWEKLPEGLGVPEVEWYWTWVVRRDDRIMARYLAGVYQNAVFLGDLKALPEAGKWWFRGLLRVMARDCLARGYGVFLTFVDDSRDGQKMLRVATHGKVAKGIPFSGFTIAGQIRDFM